MRQEGDSCPWERKGQESIFFLANLNLGKKELCKILASSFVDLKNSHNLKAERCFIQWEGFREVCNEGQVV